MTLLSVNQALDAGKLRHGECVEIQGLLEFEFENCSLNHWPKAEQREEPPQSRIWIDPDGVFSFDEEVMERWHGKRVVILGIFEWEVEHPGWDGFHEGFGHFGLVPGRIRARRIDLWKKRVKENH